MLVIMWSPKSRSESAARRVYRLCSLRVAASIVSSWASSSGKRSSASMTMRPVGTALVDTTATVRSRSAVSRFFALPAPSRSNAEVEVARRRPASCGAAGSGSRERRRSQTTGPPFCERPVWSSPDTYRPSSSAAMPSTWFTVTTPVPPMPIMRTPKSSSPTSRAGSGSSTSSVGRAVLRLLAAGTTVRKEGQSPSRQERSLLQDAWWICVLRPNSVSTGCTERQFDFWPQSPQPSQTRSLIQTRSAGSGALPRLRLRRSSAAHSWSWISTVTPSTAASSCCAAEQLLAVAQLGDLGQLDAAVAAGVLGRDDDPAHALELQPAGEVRHAQLALDGLAAGHGHVLVVEQLVGDVHAGRHRRAHRERAGVVEGAVAEVLDEVAVVGERRHADPLRALAAHLGDAGDVALALGVQEHHRVAADPGADERAFRGLHRAVVRAAGAEERCALRHRQLRRPAVDLGELAKARLH